jgi:hypothetical protein
VVGVGCTASGHALLHRAGAFVPRLRICHKAV